MRRIMQGYAIPMPVEQMDFLLLSTLSGYTLHDLDLEPVIRVRRWLMILEEQAKLG